MTLTITERQRIGREPLFIGHRQDGRRIQATTQQYYRWFITHFLSMLWVLRAAGKKKPLER
jgi:hypothetical protein